MRKVLVLLVVVAAGAVAAGLAIPADAVRVSGASLSHSALTSELQAIDASPAYQCYVEAREFTESGFTSTSVTGATPDTWSSVAAGSWANLRATQLAITAYVARHNPGAFTRSALSRARYELAIALEDAIGQAVQQASSEQGGYDCPAVEQTSSTGQSALLPGAAVLASTPSWFQREQVRAEAASLGLIALLPNAIPESGAGLASWYAAHRAEFDTTCVSVIVVSSAAEAATVHRKIADGLSFAAAARRYSLDPSKSKGGALGCFSPTNASAFSEVQHLVQTVSTGHLATVPLPNSTTYLLITPTRRTPNALHSIEKAVAAEAFTLNVEAAGLLSVEIQQRAGVQVSSDLGSWVPTGLGGQLVAPASPPASSVTNAAANSPT